MAKNACPESAIFAMILRLAMSFCPIFISYLQAAPRSNVLMYDLPLVKVLHCLSFKFSRLIMAHLLEV